MCALRSLGSRCDIAPTRHSKMETHLLRRSCWQHICIYLWRQGHKPSTATNKCSTHARVVGRHSRMWSTTSSRRAFRAGGVCDPSGSERSDVLNCCDRGTDADSSSVAGADVAGKNKRQGKSLATRLEDHVKSYSCIVGRRIQQQWHPRQGGVSHSPLFQPFMWRNFSFVATGAIDRNMRERER